MAKLLDDGGLCDRLASAARAAALQRFDKAPWIRKNVDFYAKCGANGSANGTALPE
jgi:hypothetical protein